MARGPRLDAPGTLHHVIVRGIERSKIFESDKDKEDFVFRMGRILTEGKASCLAWAVIPNHAHILLRTGITPLAKMMRRLLTGYAVSFNLRHKRSGHLFQNRYKSMVCEEDTYLLELMRYIHLNCIRAGLVADGEALDRYPWSGHSVLMGYQKRPWQAREEGLSYFGGREGMAKRSYRRFVLEGLSLGRREELTTGSRKVKKGDKESAGRPDPRVLGSETFMKKILEQQERRNQDQGLAKKKGIGIEGLMGRAAKEFGVTVEEITGGSQRWAVCGARSVFCYLASRDLGLTGRELSRMLHLTPAAIHYAVIRGQKLLKDRII